MSHDDRKKRLTGPALVVTPDWKERVRVELAVRKWSYSQLGREIGLSNSAVSRLLETDQPTSRAAARISALLGVPLPEATPHQAELARFIAHGERLRRDSPEDYERILAILESLTSRLPPRK